MDINKNIIFIFAGHKNCHMASRKDSTTAMLIGTAKLSYSANKFDLASKAVAKITANKA